MSSVLVTGGAGFIGSHTCLKLLEEGYDVFVIDSLINSDYITLEIIKKYFKEKNPSLQNNLYFYKGDIRDILLVNKIFSEASDLGKKIQAVIHFAGLKSVNNSIHDPLTYWDNNLTGTISLINLMDKNNCKTIVFSSSATIYEPKENMLIKENTIINPINPYGKTKATIESFLHDIYISDNKNWRIANLRYFNPVGAHPNGIIGERNGLEATNLFPKIMQVAQGAKKNISIYGNDWPSRDGTCVRDYIHVMDLAEGHIRTLNYLFLKENEFINLNLGTGIGKSVLQVIETFENTNGVKIPYIFEERRDGDRAEVVANIELAKATLKWEPIFELPEMCLHAWNWGKCKNVI